MLTPPISILDEAKRLYDLNWGVHWIRPNSKAPVKAGWSTGKRDSWDVVKKDYRKGFGLGVRLGELSNLGDGYLANIDVDIKSKDPKHRDEALAALEGIFPGLITRAPIVKTGMGLRLFVKTPNPVHSSKLLTSTEDIKVVLSSANVNPKQERALSLEELKGGLRVRRAWEIEFMSAGKQVVLPPSIHPETKRLYEWVVPMTSSKELPIVVLSGAKIVSLPANSQGASLRIFTPTAIKIDSLKLPPDLKDMIVNGTGCSDHSTDVYNVIRSLLKLGTSEADILTILTDKNHYLAETAYRHRGGTKIRAEAAYWLSRYPLARAKEQLEGVFKDELGDAPLLRDKADAKGQLIELVGEDWRKRLIRKSKKEGSSYVSCLFNILTILENVYGPELFREDQFSGYRVYGIKVAWGGEVGTEFSDHDRPLLAEWFTLEWGFEPSPDKLYDAVAILAARSPYHPIKDYLLALKWDGVSRIDTWLKKYLRAHHIHEEVLKYQSRIVLVALIKRVFEPGCQFDYMMILRGEQGLRKTTALKILVGEKYYTSANLRAGEKDTISKMANKWLCEFGELNTLRADIEHLKNFISTSVDRDRLVWNRLAADYPRRCIFIGTTNRDDFLIDDTGDRRFWPVSVGELDLEGLSRDRDQLLAEALSFYDSGEPLYLSKELEALARLEQAKWKPQVDTMVECVAGVLKQNDDKRLDDSSKFNSEGFSLYDIVSRLNGRDDMATQHRVGRALRLNGYQPEAARIDRRVINLWFTKGRK